MQCQNYLRRTIFYTEFKCFSSQFYIQWQTIEISVGWFIHHVFHPKYFHNTSMTGTELFIAARLY